MPPWIWQAALMPASCAACTAMAERSAEGTVEEALACGLGEFVEHAAFADVLQQAWIGHV